MTQSRLVVLALLLLTLTLTACGSEDGGGTDTGGDTNSDLLGDTSDQSDGDTNTDTAQDTITDASGSYDDCDLGSAIWRSPFAAFQSHRARFTGSGGVRVAVARDFVSVGVGESAIFDLRGLAIDRGDGIEHCILADQQLDYENTHHNWLDVASGSVGGVRYELHLFYLVVPDDQNRMGEVYEVIGYDDNDAVTWGPVELSLDNPE